MTTIPPSFSSSVNDFLVLCHGKVVAQKLDQLANSFRRLNPAWPLDAIHVHVLGALCPQEVAALAARLADAPQAPLRDELDFPYLLSFLTEDYFSEILSGGIVPQGISAEGIRVAIALRESSDSAGRREEAALARIRTHARSLLPHGTSIPQNHVVQVPAGVWFNFFDTFDWLRSILGPVTRSSAFPFQQLSSASLRLSAPERVLQGAAEASLNLGAERFARRLLVALLQSTQRQHSPGGAIGLLHSGLSAINESAADSFTLQLHEQLCILAANIRPLSPVLSALAARAPLESARPVSVAEIRATVKALLAQVEADHRAADSFVELATLECPPGHPRKRLTVFGNSSSVVRAHLALQAVVSNVSVTFVAGPIARSVELSPTARAPSFRICPGVLRQALSQKAVHPPFADTVQLDAYPEHAAANPSGLALLGAVHRVVDGNEAFLVCERGTQDFLNQYWYVNPSGKAWVFLDAFKLMAAPEFGSEHLDRVAGGGGRSLRGYRERIARSHELVPVVQRDGRCLTCITIDDLRLLWENRDNSPDGPRRGLDEWLRSRAEKRWAMMQELLTNAAAIDHN